MVAESTLSVDVQGEEAVNRLAAALQALQAHSISAQRAVSAAGAAAASRSATAQIADVTRQVTTEVGTLGQRLGKAFSSGVTTALRAPFDALRAASQVAGRSLLSFAGPLGEVATRAGVGGTAILALGAVVAGLAGPILGLIAGFKLLRTTFGWAQEAADAQITVAGRTRRIYPQLMGDALTAAEDEMQVRMGVATALFGQGADQMQQSVTRRFTEYRLGRGLRGEQDLFSRWGITPEAMQRFEQMTGSRLDLAAWLRLWVINREQLQEQLKNAQTPEEKRLLENRLAQLADDATKLFGQQFSDMMLAMNDTDLVRLQNNLRRAIPLGAVQDSTRRAINFKIAFESLRETISQIGLGIGGDVSPAITDFMTQLNNKILDVGESGRSLGMALRELASTFANQAWKALADIMARIDVPRINSWIEIVNSWEPKDTADKLILVFDAVWSVGEAVVNLAAAIKAFLDILPDWVKSGTVIGGAAAGGAVGAAVAGPAGAAVGAIGGGLAGALSDYLTGGRPTGIEAAGAISPQALVPPTAPGMLARAGGAASGAFSNISNWLAGAGPTSAQTTGTAAAATLPATPAPTTAAPAPAGEPAAVAPPARPVTPTPLPAAEPRAPEAARETILSRISDVLTPPAVRAEVERAAAPATAAVGPPPPAPEEVTATAPDAQRSEDKGFVASIQNLGAAFLQGHQAAADERLLGATQQLQGATATTGPSLITPHGATQWPDDDAARQAGIEALKGAAAGRAMSVVSADVQEGSAAQVIMRQNTFGGHEAAAAYDPYADTSATRNKVRGVLGPWLNRNFGVTLPGTELALAAAQGTTEPAAWESAASQLTTTPTSRERFTGGMTTEDGTNFGTAAGVAVREQLKGVNVPAGGQAPSAWEAQAPAWTGLYVPSSA